MEEVALKEYCREVEPDGETKSYAWSTAIGLQAMGGLQISKFLIDTAIQNIAGGISIKVARKTIEDYYGEGAGGAVDRKAEEADRLAARTFALLTEGAFSFSVNTYISIHRKLFEGMEGSAGSLRDFNIKRKEWVLDEESVLYAGEAELQEMLACLFMEEKDFSYKGLSMEEIIRHLARFMPFLKEVQESQPFSLLNIWNHLAFLFRTILLRKIPCILGMRLSVQTIPICRKGFLEQRNILNFFFGTCS